LLLVDRRGVVHSCRDDLNRYKQPFAVESERRSLADALDGADVFIGVSGADLVNEAMLASMAPKPVLFALANPNPEIKPELAHAVRQDLIMATGRSDYPNQVNNVLGFPFIFRGALDVRACCINEAMKVALVHALRELAKEPVPAVVLHAYGLEELGFCPEYIIPKPFDPRLIERLPPAVARAAIESGVARAPWPEHYPSP
jgi:malate dehydrogenase (oxaloacetate-decarboxylating)(NADP+)